MRLIWKYFIPILLVFMGWWILGDDPNAPFSQTIPVSLGRAHKPLAWTMIVVGLLLGIIVFLRGAKHKGNGRN